MTTHHGKNGVVKVGANAVAEATAWEFTDTVPTEQDTAMGDAWQTHKTGIPGWSGSVTCWWDPSDTNGQEALDIGAEVGLELYPDDDASGAVYYSGQAIVTEIRRGGAREGMVEATFNFLGQGARNQAAVA